MQASLTLEPISKFSGIFTSQVHPNHELLKCLANFNTCADRIKVVVYKKYFPDHKIGDPVPDPFFTLNIDSTNLSQYHEEMTDLFLENISLQTGIYFPPETLGYCHALKYLEEEILSKDVKTFKPEKLLKLVKIVNGFVCGKFAPSEYRKNYIIIWDPRVFPTERNRETFKLLDKYIQDKASQESLAIWKSSLRTKVWKMKFVKERATQNFTPAEFETLKLIAEISQGYREIPKSMNEFVNEFATKLFNEEDTILLMAWTHQKIVQIHPFVDGNGRTARLMMNCVGMLKGKSPLLIDSDDNYTEAVSTRNYKKFAEYLRDLEDKQPRCSDFVDKCVRNLFDNMCDQKNIESLSMKFKAVKL